MEKKLIKRAELNVQQLDGSFTVGTYLYYRGNLHLELYIIKEMLDENRFVIQQVDSKTLEVQDEQRQVSLSTLKEYYQPAHIDVNSTRDLALRLLDGETFEDMPSLEEDSTSLLHLGSKETLSSLRRDADCARIVAEEVQKYAQMVADEMRDELMKKVRTLDSVIKGMNAHISTLDYVIQTIETYAGLKEDIVTLQRGESADENVPIVIRQAVIYMDEELALMDTEFDWKKIESFDKWLLEGRRYEELLPDVKSIVAIKPRRKDKVYTYGTTREDVFHNWVMNQNNHITLFLIRNGENLYRLDSEHISLEDRMFPNVDEYKDILEKEQKQSRWHHNEDNYMSTVFRKRFTKVAFLLQGLMERSEVFAPHNFKGSIVKMEGLEEHIQMSYELDLSKQLSDGRPTFKDWVKGLNERLHEGSRILLIKRYYNTAGYEFLRDDYVTYYSNDWNTPGYPEDGVYTLHGAPKNSYKSDKFPFIIKFFGTNDTYSWQHGFNKRKNRTSIYVSPMREGILNYDEIKMEDIDYYLTSRLHRSQYFHFVVMLQKVKRLMLEEQEEESNFIKMIQGQVLRKGLTVKAGYSLEQVIRKSIETVKSRLKWKRPISAKEKETYTLVERNLFSKQNLEKYFTQTK